ncbi:MAG: sulfur carrier protein ThiS [Acidiferrobacterales bacterium]|nr:sulfur carrier protein ThiS [Acidiferrobacterales bacterium]
MQLTVKLVGTFARYLPTPSQGNMVEIEVDDGTTAAQLAGILGLPETQPFMVSVNDEIVPKSDRESKVLQSTDSIKIIPPLKGG